MRHFSLFLLALASTASYAMPKPKQEAKEESRLPNSVKPMHYDVELFPNLDAESFSGKATIAINVLETVDKIVLHSDVNVLKAAIDGKDVKPKQEKDFLHLESQVAKGRHTLNFDFNRELRKDMLGFYLSTYWNGSETIKLATTQFQSMSARSAFPCFDEPNFKATFRITIDRTRIGQKYISFKSVSNTMLDASKSTPYRDVFLETPIMSTYLVAFVISDFEKTANGTFGVYAKKDAKDKAQLSVAVNDGPQLLENIRSYTNINYYDSMRKIDNIAIPDFQAGAMENWGIATYREAALLFDSDKSTANNIQRIRTILAHELAHMWFGDLVTLDWWDYTWLNEGFATYFEFFAAAMINPDWCLDEQFVLSEVHSAMYTDSLSSTVSMNHKVSTFPEVSAKFNDISYAKGGSVIRMLEHVVGTKKFKEALNKYLTEKSLSNSKPDDLWKQFDTDTKEKMKSWADKPGYPVVHVKLNESGISLSQDRFYLSNAPAEKELWNIPITYATAKNNNFTNTTVDMWLTMQRQKIDAEVGDDWIMLNKLQVGKVNYDNLLWNRIANALSAPNFSNIHRLNRAQVVDDIFNLARSGKVSYAIALNVTSFLGKDTDYFPWYPALKAFSFLNKRFTPDDAAGKHIRAHLKKMLGVFDDVTMENTAKEKDHIKILRNSMILHKLCELGNEKCVSSAIKNFDSYIEGNEISPNIKSTVFCTAVRVKPEENFNKLFKNYTTTGFSTEEVTILNALGCSENEKVIKRYLSLSISASSGIRKQDANTVFTSILNGSSKGKTIALDFLIENLKEIKEFYIGGLNTVSKIIMALADTITTVDEQAKLERFLNENKESLVGVNIQAVSDTINGNLKWVKDNKQKLLDYFESKKDGSGFAVNMRSSTYMVVLTVILAIINSIN